MPKTPEECVARWARKCLGVETGEFGPTFLSRYRAAVTSQFEVDTRARMVLAGEPVGTSDYFKYYSFVRGIPHLYRQYHFAATFPDVMKGHRAKYIAWGCREPVLKRLEAAILELCEGQSSH